MGNSQFVVNTADKFIPTACRSVEQNVEFDLKLLDSDVPRSYIVTATKPLIDELLRRNTSNRVLSKSNIVKLRTEIALDDYMETSSGIGVSRCGVLTNGQHRLEAIRLEGYPPVPILLVVGLNRRSQTKEDRQNKRDLAQSMKFARGFECTRSTVSVARFLLGSNALLKSKDFVYNLPKVSDSAIESFVIANFDLLKEVIQWCGKSPAPVVAAIFVYALHDPARAMQFARQFVTGEQLHSSNPAYRLRSLLNREGKYSYGGSSAMVLFGLSVTAVVTHAKGLSCLRLCESQSWAKAPWPKWLAHTLQEGVLNDIN